MRCSQLGLDANSTRNAVLDAIEQMVARLWHATPEYVGRNDRFEIVYISDTSSPDHKQAVTTSVPRQQLRWDDCYSRLPVIAGIITERLFEGATEEEFRLGIKCISPGHKDVYLVLGD